MSLEHQPPDPPAPGDPGGVSAVPAGPAGPGGSWLGITLVAVGILLVSLLIGWAGGVIWSALVPRVAFQVTGPGAANVVNPETTAFVAADLGYCLIGAVGGLIIGLAGYFAGVRRHGPVPMLAVVAGSCAAAVLAWRIGQDSGLSQFNHELASSATGTILRAPLVLGAQNPSAPAFWAMAFWPLLACLAAGGLTFATLVRDRRRAARLRGPGELGLEPIRG